MVLKDKSKEVAEYEFPDLLSQKQKKGITSFEYAPIVPTKTNQIELENEIRSEREFAQKNEFTFLPFVQDFRGIKKQEEEDYQKRLAHDVETYVARLKDDAFQKGFNEGKDLGKKEIYGELTTKVDENLKQFLAMMDEVRKTKETIIAKEINEIYSLIRTLTKWVILRELKDDGQYVNRLLEKLIVDLQTKNNVLVKVNLDWFKAMPEVVAQVEKTFGGLTNTRIEFNHDLGQYGMMVESESNLVDGTIEAQFSNLDKLFDLAVAHD